MKFRALNQNSLFLRGYKKGQCFVGPLVVIYVTKNRVGYLRVGITSGKKIGTAVVRNRRRRVIREALRAARPRQSSGYDLIFVARGRTRKAKSRDLVPFIRNSLEKAGVALD